MSAVYVVGEVRRTMAHIPSGSVDLVLTSPPFLSLRSYLPNDHPDKGDEIGSEPTPAEFTATLLGLTAEWRRVIAPHGSICVELGDTFSGSGGAGGDYSDGGLREGQQAFSGSAAKRAREGVGDDYRPSRAGRGLASAGGRSDRPADVAAGLVHDRSRPGPDGRDSIPGWPMDKSLAMIPELYRIGLAYGINALTGQQSPAGSWRVRNNVRWVRPNPPVGALGDKFRPGTSEMVIACLSRTRWFDMDAVRTAHLSDPEKYTGNGYTKGHPEGDGDPVMKGNPAGAPPNDWSFMVADVVAEMVTKGATPKKIGRAVAALCDVGDAWEISPGGYKGAHFATWPTELLVRPIEALCPRRVCRTCGEPSRRIVDTEKVGMMTVGAAAASKGIGGGDSGNPDKARHESTLTTTCGWSTCGCEGCDGIRLDGFHSGSGWRPGIVLDPFAGSGTTLVVATGYGRDAIGIDMDERNVHLARERVGMWLEEATAAELPNILNPVPEAV